MPEKDKDDEKTSKWTYDGSKEEEWDSFDRRIMRYVRKHYGIFGEGLWMGTHPNIDLLEGEALTEYIEKVWEAIEIKDDSKAWRLWDGSTGFWRKSWHKTWRDRQTMLIKDYIEEHSKGAVEMEVVDYDGDISQLRKHLFQQFGSGTSGDIHTKEAEYDAGLPEKGQKAFPMGVNMKEKLRKLHAMKMLFWNMCDPAKRAAYPYCQDEKLIRIVLEHVNSDYKECISRLTLEVSLRKEIKKAKLIRPNVEEEGKDDGLSTQERSFDNDWLPSWTALKSALIDEYVKLQKSKPSSSTRLPVALVGDVRCYACGIPGHKRGDASCGAGREDVHPSAPAEWKERFKARMSGGGSSSQSTSKKPCHQFNFGKGKCSYGAACRFSHSKSGSNGSDGGSRKVGKDKFSPSQKKAVSAMLSSQLKKVLTDASKKRGKKRKHESGSDDEGDDSLATILASCMMASSSRTFPRHPAGLDFSTLDCKCSTAMTTSLHNTGENMGWDTDASLTITCFKSDMLWIDSSKEALDSVPMLQGINGGSSVVGGIGPCLVRSKSGEYLLDPEAVYLEPGEGQPLFRVAAAQRFKAMGVRMVQCFEQSDDDVLQDKQSGKTIKLSEEGGKDRNGLPRTILVLGTQPVPKFPITSVIKQMVKEVKNGKRSAMLSVDDFDEPGKVAKASLESRGMSISTLMVAMLLASSVMVFNEAKLPVHERTRLYVRRLGYPSTAQFGRMCRMEEYGDLPDLCVLNEDSVVQDAAKFRKRPYKRQKKTLLNSSDRRKLPPWWRAYSDGYGGGESLGGESYDGAVGGYLFVCPSTGDNFHRLYASHEQYPSALFQFLVHVESEGHTCKEIYIDTFTNNISAEAEEVAALFQCKLVPVSAGSPEEVAFVETAHRIIAGRSRAMLLGAPHLPKWCWALADKYAVYVGRLLPQSTREWLCSYYLNTGRAPNWRNMCVHVFGAPCKYAPMVGPVHKRGELTEDGYFVGVQHPMALVLRKSDMKLISVSTKKLKVYESAYCAPLEKELTLVQDRNEAEENGHDEKQPATIPEVQVDGEVGGKVHSIKSMRDHTIPVPNTTAPNSFRPPTQLDASAATQSSDPGEGEYVPEHKAYSRDQLAVDLQEMEDRVRSTVDNPTIRDKVIAALKKGKAAASNEVSKGELKRGKKSKHAEVSKGNVLTNKRRMVKIDKSESAGGSLTVHKKEVDSRGSLPKKKHRTKVTLMQPACGDLVSAKATVFDGDNPGSYSRDNPARCFGVVTRTQGKGRVLTVNWAQKNSSSDYITEILSSEVKVEKKKVKTPAILAVMLVEGESARVKAADKGEWPRDFFEALVKVDWRKWVEAVKKEIDSWLDFDAYTEICISEKTPGASIVPLGELYTRKRDLTYKFRQYLMGNLLKAGKDFVDTFSSTISWDGIRWCASMACACDKLLYGLDAVTGFLQASEKFDLYAFLPSHGEYSSLSYEELALLRRDLLDLVEKDGPQGLKKFAAANKRASRVNPSKCYRLNSSIYGSPSANHAWEALFQGAHINTCGMTLSEVEPSLFVRIEVDENDIVVEWLIAKIWTDDVRYFGTDGARKKYEKQIASKVKVKFLGVTGEFVGTEFLQDLKLGICELKSPKYWELAAEKFKHLFPNGYKKRRNALSILDEKIMLETVTDDEFLEAKGLPYRELCGVCSYPAACSKLELRYAISVCGRHRTKWGVKQFEVLKRVFEYGLWTKEMGLLYSKGLDKHGINALYCYADSAHSAPRSQGCTIVMMNGAAVTLTSKKHTISAASTCHDEMIEFSIASNKVAGLRNMMEEVGMPEDDPTVIYQDNEATIQIAMNRGSLSNRSKHIDLKVLQSRNKIEDGIVKPVFEKSGLMFADLGTKALPDGQFEFLRDQMNGYSLVKKNRPAYKLPDYVV